MGNIAIPARGLEFLMSSRNSDVVAHVDQRGVETAARTWLC